MKLPQISASTKVVLLLGLEGPEVLRALLQQSTEDRVHIIVDFVDRDRRALMMGWDLEAIIADERFGFVTGLNPEDFSTFLLKVFSTRKRLVGLGAVEILSDSRMSEDHQRLSRMLIERFNGETGFLISSFGYRADGMLGLKYLIENLSWLEKTPGVSALKDITQGIPAIIASSGPSLARSIPLLKENEGKYVLISLDASLKVLMKAGMRPHLVCTLERDMMSRKFFEEVAHPEAHLVSFPVVPPGVIRAYEGKHWAAFRGYRHHYFFDQQLQRGSLQCGHSVAHMAVALAHQMGCNPIVLVGQDLSFDPESLRSHPKGVAYEEWSEAQTEAELVRKLESEGDRLYWQAGNKNESVPTRGYYIVFAREFGMMASTLSGRLINATDGGLRLPGVPWKELAPLISSWPIMNSDPMKRLDGAYAAAPKGQRVNLGPFFDHTDLLCRRIQQDLDIAQHLKTDLVLKNMLATWETLKADHVCEGFAIEILGESVIRQEIRIHEMISRGEKISEIVAVCCEMFADVKSTLLEAKNLLENR